MTDSNLEQELSKSWWKEHEERLAKEKEEAHKVFSAEHSRLVELGVTHLRIEYDGYGDSGCVEEIVGMSNGQTIELPDDLVETLTEAAEKLLPSGWADNDGGYGAVVLSVADRRLAREHYARYVETEYEEEEWTL